MEEALKDLQATVDYLKRGLELEKEARCCHDEDGPYVDRLQAISVGLLYKEMLKKDLGFDLEATVTLINAKMKG